MAVIPEPDVLDILVRCSRSDDERLREWIRNYQTGLRPIGGAWRSEGEHASMWAQSRRKSVITLLELGAVVLTLLLVDLILFLFIQLQFS